MMETGFEKYFTPDLVSALSQTHQQLGQVLSLLQTPVVQFGQNTSVAGRSNLGATLSLPIAYEQLLQTLLAAGEVGEVIPFYTRQNLLVPAGQTLELYTEVPSGEIAQLVSYADLRTDTDTTECLLTVSADNLPQVLVGVSLNYPVRLMGVMLPPVRTVATYIVTNNDTVDITFTVDAQMAVLSSGFLTNTWNPITKGQLDVIKGLASAMSQLTENGG